MLLTLTTTHRPATDLGYLLAKNPARPQSFDLGFGTAHVFYPDAQDEVCSSPAPTSSSPTRPMARHPTESTPKRVVREGGHRVVVAADSSARSTLDLPA